MLRQIRWQLFFSFSVLIIILFALGGYLLDAMENLDTVTMILGTVAFLGVVIISLWVSSNLKSSAKFLADSINQLASGEIEYTIQSVNPGELQVLQETIQTSIPAFVATLKNLESDQKTFSSIIKQMTDGVIIADERNRIRLINPAAERIFNINAGQVQGQTLIVAIRHHQLVEICRKCRRRGEEQHISLELPYTNVFIHGIATLFDPSLPGHIMLIIQDLTRVRHLETVRRDFISNLSHELRTPLASIRALAETLRNTALEDPPAARRFLGRMETEVDALTHMVSELMELSRIESGRAPLEMKSVSPLALLRSAQSRLCMQAERADLKIVIQCPTDLPPVWADIPRLEQVFVNLIHNAIKFSHPRGEITLSARELGGKIEFSVQDEGIGIPADDLSRIFERFYKTDRARTGGGTGLGLSIARHLVESHGGHIWADSMEGHGSTFFFTIPSA